SSGSPGQPRQSARNAHRTSVTRAKQRGYGRETAPAYVAVTPEPAESRRPGPTDLHQTCRSPSTRDQGGQMFANSDELLKYGKDEGVERVEVRFCDLPGIMQPFTVPVSSFTQSVFDDGLCFAGSPSRWFRAVHGPDRHAL